MPYYGGDQRQDGPAVWNDHVNDIGDWCEHSGTPLDGQAVMDELAAVGSAACPARCANSRPE